MKKNQIYPPDRQRYFVPKLFLCMKLTVFLFFLSMLGATASSFSQQSKFNLQLKNITVKEVLDELKSQSDYQFFYSNDDFDVNRKVDVDLSNASIENVLEQLLGNMDVTYKIVDKSVIISKSDVVWSVGEQQQQQQVSVSGTVTDGSGQPLPGVTVVEKGTTNGTITDFDGKYILKNIPAGATLIFSFVGMENKEILLEGRTQVDVVLVEQTIGLEEVVAIGYGVQRKEAVTGSVASVGGEELRAVAASNISQSLQGRVAGVEMMQTSSRPGAEMQIRIRGTRSLTASNDPLIVLDGIPFAGSLQDINPSDIKSLDILKDASATAVYGSRGANGVIIVTTFKGDSKDKEPVVNYSGYYGVKSLMNKYPMMNADEFIAWREEAINNGASWQYGVDEDKSINTDWQDLMFEKGMVTSHDIGLSGATKGGGYSFGAGYYDETSVLPGQEYERFSLRANFDQKLGEHVKVGVSSISSYGIVGGETSNILGSLLSLTPITNPYNADGSLKTGAIAINNLDNNYYNPLLIESLGDKWKEQRKNYSSYNSFYGEVNIIDGLRYRLNAGLNYRQSNYGKYNGSNTPYNANDMSNATIENVLTTNWVVENLLYYDKTFAEKHTLGLVAMYSAEQTESNTSNMVGQDVASDFLQYYNFGLLSDDGEITVDPEKQIYYKRGLTSAMARATYNYDGKYMATATVRSDGSSVLANGKKWHTYPALSVGWLASSEEFMQSIKWLNFLKLRVGYGQTSNQAIQPYQTLGGLSTNYYNFGSRNVSGYYVSNLPNYNLGWEYSTNWNFAMEFHALDNRLSGTFEYYTQKTKDVLVAQSLPPTSGVTESFMTNIGQTQNKGVELSLNGTVIKDLNGWSWDVGVNFFVNRNKILELASGQQYDKGNGWFVGQPIDVIYDFKKIGIWQKGEENEVTKYEGSTGQVGMIKVEYTGDYDAQGNPTRQIGQGTTLEDDDRQILGSIEPDFQGGFNTNVGYRGFDLSVIGSFKSGGILVSALHSPTSYLNMNNGRRGQIKIDYWTEDNPTNAYPKPYGPEVSNNPKYASTMAYFDASYVKVSTITLAYNFKKDWLQKLKLDKLRLYVTAQNPFVFGSKFYKETGLDPQPNSKSTDTNTQAVEGAKVVSDRIQVVGYNTPATRNFLFGLNVTF